MPRTARASVGGVCYHVMNRGNAQAAVFHGEQDYAAFVDLIARACGRLPMRVLGYCLMPNYFHLVLWPRADGDLGRGMQWLLTSHVRRYHRLGGGSGHVWQGRFKAFPIQKDGHLLAVLRYVERNPLLARLVKRAQQWPWSSLGGGEPDARPAFLRVGPVSRPPDWLKLVNQPQTKAEVEALGQCVSRGTPYGSPRWLKPTARRLGLEHTLRPPGRPKKKPDSKK